MRRKLDFSDRWIMMEVNQLRAIAQEQYEKRRRIWDYKDPALIEYIRREWQGLVEKRGSSLLYCFYQAHNRKIKGRKGRLRKFPFFIFWLSQIIKNFDLDKFYFIFHKLYEEDPNSIFHLPQEIGDNIIPRYKNRKIVENEWVEIDNRIIWEREVNSGKFNLIFDDSMIEIVNNLINQIEIEWAKKSELRLKIIRYIKNKKKTTRRKLSRKFTKKYSELFDILFNLICESIIYYNKEKREFVFITDRPTYNGLKYFYHRIIHSGLPGK
mgnify:CR=1 FL=1